MGKRWRRNGKPTASSLDLRLAQLPPAVRCYATAVHAQRRRRWLRHIGVAILVATFGAVTTLALFEWLRWWVG